MLKINAGLEWSALADLENGDEHLSARMRGLLAQLWQEWKQVEEQILSSEIETI